MLADLRDREYSRLDRLGETYLDFTGAALYAESQIERHAQRLRDGVFGNPHSANGPSQQSTLAIESARKRVLEFLDAPDDYEVIFTANTSGAIKLVAEGYRFSSKSGLVLSADNHNSMNGIREFATRRGAPVNYIPLDTELRLVDADDHLRAAARDRSLFGFPAQSNFSGVRHSLSLVAAAQSHGYRVLLDAAAFLPTNRLSLRAVPADFVVLSGYKILGFPTGVGALVARRSRLEELDRPWFAGGTVDYASVQHGSHQLQGGAEAFEDGTPAFLDIAALEDGFEFLDGIERQALNSHVAAMTSYAIDRLRTLTRRDGSPLVETYGPRSINERGGTVTFNVLRENGTTVAFDAVVSRARAAQVSLRGGCFCNPGAAEAAFGFPHDETRRCLDRAAAGGFTVEGLSKCLGPKVPVGAVRASFGIPTTLQDIDRAIEVIESFARADRGRARSQLISPVFTQS